MNEKAEPTTAPLNAAEYGFYEMGQLPANTIDKIRAESNQLIENYTVSFITEKFELTGSATLLNVCGLDGFLTAYHVAREVFKNPTEKLRINIRPYPHSFSIPITHLEHHNVGKQESTANEHLGPDLSFIRILDRNAIGTIRAAKSFCYVTEKTFNQEYLRVPAYREPLYLAGAPAELCRKFLEKGAPTIGATHFVGESTFHALVDRDGFDYVELKLIAGDHNFPSNYQGFSGGGIWVVPFTIDPDKGMSTINYVGPYLVGVAFHQSAIETGERLITGHGPRSIHTVLRNSLQATATRTVLD